MDGRQIAETPLEANHQPVTTAVYTLVAVMNEDDPNGTDEYHREAFAQEFQRALDDGYFIGVRYDSIDFEVVSRVPVATQEGHEQ